MAGRIRSAIATGKALGKWAVKHPRVGKMGAGLSRAGAYSRATARKVVGAKVYKATLKGKRKYATAGAVGLAAGGGVYAVKRKRSPKGR